MERAADLVASYGGSLSGEHGDGQQRGELLVRMFGEELVRAFGQCKSIFDPGAKMNPGKVVAPYRVDENLRLGAAWTPTEPTDLYFGYPQDGGSFSKAATRCVGVGKCRQLASNGTVMCPSYLVTHEEEDATRGRARLLFEMLNGHRDGPITDGWRSEAVHDALDLCLSCKGCKKDCPVDVDMATYKAEFLAHYYQGRLRPRSDYAMGYLPVIARLITAARLGPVVNALSHAPGLSRVATFAAGVEPREIPLFASESLSHWFSRRPVHAGSRGTVMLWPDSFNENFHPHVGRAAVAVMEAAGWTVILPDQPLCCGLTWISTGQLDVAKKVLTRTVRALSDHVRAGGLVVGLEPSCTAVFRSDLTELLGHHPDLEQDVKALAAQVVTLAELLREHTDGWTPPRLDATATIQVHCHQHAIMGFDADTALMQDMGVTVDRLDSGCCGLAGNFGFQPGHLGVSRDCAERVLLPALRDAPEQNLVLADGFSCRTQIHELDSGGRDGMHLAEMLAGALDGGAPSGPGKRGRPEDRIAARPAVPSAAARAAALAGVGALTVGAVAGVTAVVRAALVRAAVGRVRR